MKRHPSRTKPKTPWIFPETMRAVVARAAGHIINALVGAAAKGQDGKMDRGLSPSSFDGSVEENKIVVDSR
jgi:hypothetical protein